MNHINRWDNLTSLDAPFPELIYKFNEIPQKKSHEILFVENPPKITRTHELSKVLRYEVNTEKQVVCCTLKINNLKRKFF